MWFKFIIGILLTTPALAWRLTQDFQAGFYWQNLPINITVVDANPTRKARIEKYAVMGIKEWESATRLDLWNDVEGAPNIIRWSENFQAETNMDPTSVLAVAVRYTGGPYFARTEIIINGNHFLNQDDVHLLTTITHELGHTMGLDHSERSEAIMAPTLQPSFQGVQIDDRQGMDEAVAEMKHREEIGFVSPLAYQGEDSSKSPMSCGTVAVATSTPASGPISLAAGILIAFVRRILKWVKSLF
jgi:hypothetical protein